MEQIQPLRLDTGSRPPLYVGRGQTGVFLTKTQTYSNKPPSFSPKNILNDSETGGHGQTLVYAKEPNNTQGFLVLNSGNIPPRSFHSQASHIDLCLTQKVRLHQKQTGSCTG